MKKSLIAMIAALFCSALMAQVLVYDYAASFKRIDVTQKILKNGTKKTHYDSAKLVSDKFTGYMVINACQECGGKMLTSATVDVAVPTDNYEQDENAAIVYITRKGDKAKNVYRAIGTFEGNMFGANATKLKGNWVFGSKTKFTDASGWLVFPFSWGEIGNTGFLGFDQQFADALCYNGGFGKVTFKTTSTPVVVDCEDDVLIATCAAIKSLSGSMLSDVNYTGVCGEFLFDVCNQAADNTAPIPGTYTLKLNDNKKFQGLATFKAAEDAIIEKEKWAGKTIYVPADDKGYTVYGLIQGKYWGTL